MKSELETEKEMEKYQILTFADILRALKMHPDWLDELRRLILTTELLELPKRLDELIKKVDGLDIKVDKIEQDVSVLKQDMNVLKQDANVLKQDVNVLKQDVSVLKQDVSVLKQDVNVLKLDVNVLKQDVSVLKQDVSVLKQDVNVLKLDVNVLKQDVSYLKGEFGRFKGRDFERSIREKYYAYFGRLLRKSKFIPFEEILPLIDDAELKGLLTEQEKESILKLDLILQGEIKKTKKQILLAVEITYSLQESDIQRVAQRADLLSKLFNKEVIPTVVFVEAKEETEKLAEESGLFLIKTEY